MEDPKSKLTPAKRIRYLLEYIPLKFLVFILSSFPRKTGLKIGRGIGNLACRLMPSRYKIAKQNIVSIFPGITDKRVDEIIKGCWHNLGETAAEVSVLPTLKPEEYLPLYETEGMEHLRESYAKGKGVLMLTGHYGPWEPLECFFPRNGIKTCVVARRIKNPYVDDLVNGFRKFHGNEVIFAREAVKNSLRALKAGKMVVVLIDHRVMEGDLQIPFLGKPAYTTSFPAFMALRQNVPVHFLRCWREGEKVKTQITPAMSFEGIPNSKEGVVTATIQMNKVLEDWIREKPEPWLWIHNRWKT